MSGHKYESSWKVAVRKEQGLNTVAFGQLPPPKKNLGNQTTKVQIDPRERILTLKEVERHNNLDRNGWIILDDKVYVISRYAPYHQGGYYVLSQYVGDDCTAVFKEFHRWVDAHRMLRNYFVGKIQRTPSYSKHLPQLTRGLTSWFRAEFESWETITRDGSTRLITFACEEFKELIKTQSISGELPKHVMVRLKKSDTSELGAPIRPYTPIAHAFEIKLPFKNLDPQKIHLIIRFYDRGRFTKMLKEKINTFVEAQRQKAPKEELKTPILDFAFVRSHLSIEKNGIKVLGDKGQTKENCQNLSNLLLFAGGTGILPILQILQYFLGRAVTDEATPHLYLFYANVSRDTTILYEWLVNLARSFKNTFNVLFVMSRPSKKWKGETGHLNGELLSRDWSTLAWVNRTEALEFQSLVNDPDTRYILSGPPGFEPYGIRDNKKVNMLELALLSRGFESQYILHL